MRTAILYVTLVTLGISIVALIIGATLALDCAIFDDALAHKIRSKLINKNRYKGDSKMVELKDTAEMMLSPDYRERFRAEYHQTKTRYLRLREMLVKHEAGTLDFTPTCSPALLREQLSHMGKYLHCLEVRAEVEHISLEV